MRGGVVRRNRPASSVAVLAGREGFGYNERLFHLIPRSGWKLWLV